MYRQLHSFLQAKIRIWELARIAGCAICFFSIAGLAGRSWWMLDLASHFRFQYAVLLSIDIQGFWPQGGAISHVSIHTGSTSVPDAGATAAMLGVGVLGLATIRRKA